MTFSPKPVAQLLGSNGPVHAVAYSAGGGTYILTGSSDKSIRLYNPGSPSQGTREGRLSDSASREIREGRLIQTYSGHGYPVLSVAVAGDNETFASGGGDRSVFVWDVARALTVRRMEVGAGRVNVVRYAGEGDGLVVAGGGDTRVRVFDMRGHGVAQELQGAKDSITGLAVGGGEIIAGSADGKVRTWDVRMGRVLTDTLGASVGSVALTRDGAAILVGTLDGEVRLMDRRSGRCLGTYKAEKRRNDALRVDAVLGGGERWVLAGDEEDEEGEGRVWAWDVLTGEVLGMARVPWGGGARRERKGVVSCLAWRGGGWGDQFCAGGASGVVTVFEA